MFTTPDRNISSLKKITTCLVLSTGLCVSAVSPSSANSDPESIQLDGVVFDVEWFNENVNSTDYRPLSQSTGLYSQVVRLNKKVSAFEVKDTYCHQEQQKEWDLEDVQELLDDLESLDQVYSELNPLAAMVKHSDQAEKYDSFAHLITDVVGNKIADMRLSLVEQKSHIANESTECSDAKKEAYESANDNTDLNVAIKELEEAFTSPEAEKSDPPIVDLSLGDEPHDNASSVESSEEVSSSTEIDWFGNTSWGIETTSPMSSSSIDNEHSSESLNEEYFPASLTPEDFDDF